MVTQFEWRGDSITVMNAGVEAELIIDELLIHTTLNAM
jgi:hypothetical protein